MNGFKLEEIDFIYDNKEAVKEALEAKDYRVNLDRGNYVLIAEDRFNRVPPNLEVTLILIDRGIWQYRYCNTNPSDKSYLTAVEYIDKIVAITKESME